MSDLTPLARLAQEDLAAVWSLCPVGHIFVWSMAGLEEGVGREGGRPIASFLPSLDSALHYLSVSSTPSPLPSAHFLFSFLSSSLSAPSLHCSLSLSLAPWVSPFLLPELHSPQVLLHLGWDLHHSRKD